jgi:branched-chain amino acid transport system ATP-binding protein
MSEARAAEALSLREISSGYGAVSVVKSVTLSVRPGEIVAVLGKNGMGKSTLLKTILGLIPLRGGVIHVGGVDQTGLTPARMIAWGLSYVPQEQALFQDLTIRDNLRLAVRGDGELGAALDYVFGYFPFLRERLKQKAGTLSGGEQKMLILAHASPALAAR